LPLCLALQSWAADAHAGARILLLEFGGNKPEVLREKVAKSLEDAGNNVGGNEQVGFDAPRQALECRRDHRRQGEASQHQAVDLVVGA
jgi:hypothetical protein